MSLHPVDGILFDIDDTLVDTRGAFAVALLLLPTGGPAFIYFDF